MYEGLDFVHLDDSLPKNQKDEKQVNDSDEDNETSDEDEEDPITFERRDILKKCAGTSLNSKLLASYKEFFSEMAVSAVEKLDENILDKDLIGIYLHFTQKIKRYLEEYNGIIELSANPAFFHCIVCNFKGKWISIPGHVKTKSHCQAIKDLTQDKQLESKQVSCEEKEEQKSFQEKDIKKDEAGLYFKLAKFILENRLPLSIVNLLIDFVKSISFEFRPDILSKAQISINTLEKIIVDCISKELREDILSKLKTRRPFSLAVDESSDIYGNSYLAVTAKLLETDLSKSPVNKLVSILLIEESTTREAIYDKIKETVLFNEDIMNNFLGISTDEGRNLSGSGLGLYGRLHKELPHIVKMNDLSHQYNLIFKSSLKGFPENIM